MALIEVITHQYDDFVSVNPQTKQYESGYMMWHILLELNKRGHKIKVLKGVKNTRREGDVAILHADCTVIPDEYIEYIKAFPVCVNGRVHDISKRNISMSVVDKTSGWAGPVIVKSNYNFQGLPEVTINKIASLSGTPAPFPGVQSMEEYLIFDSIKKVPADYFANKNAVVEKYIPEIHPDGYGIRSYIFCGAEEKCALYVSKEKIVKGSNFVRKEETPVPEGIRRIRQKLGFDYGKFEFVMHDGKVTLLDANKTIGVATQVMQSVQDKLAAYTNGIEAVLAL